MQVVMDAVNNDGNQQMQKTLNQMIYILIVMRATFFEDFLYDPAYYSSGTNIICVCLYLTMI